MNNLEFLHSNKYADVMEMAKKFVSTSHTRPILLFANHAKGGTIIATNSHKAMIVENAHGFKTNYLVNPKTLEFATGDYPDLLKNLDNEGSQTQITITSEHIKIWLQMHKSINQMLKNIYKNNNKVVELKFEEGKLVFSVGYTGQIVNFALPFENISIKEAQKEISYNAEYMRDCLEVHSKLNSKMVEIKFKSLYMDLDNREGVKTILTPIKTY